MQPVWDDIPYLIIVFVQIPSSGGSTLEQHFPSIQLLRLLHRGEKWIGECIEKRPPNMEEGGYLYCSWMRRPSYLVGLRKHNHWKEQLLEKLWNNFRQGHKTLLNWGKHLYFQKQFIFEQPLKADNISYVPFPWIFILWPLLAFSQVSVYRPCAAYRLAVRNCLVSEWIWIRVNVFFLGKNTSVPFVDFLPSFFKSIKPPTYVDAVSAPVWVFHTTLLPCDNTSIVLTYC